MINRVPVKYRNFPGPFKSYAPRVTRPIQIWFWVVTIPLVVALTVCGRMISMPYLGISGAFVGMAFLLFLQRRWRSRLIRLDWLLCLQCAYPLGGGAPRGHCPECGRLYTHASARWGWKVLCGEWSDEMDPPPPLPKAD